MINIFEVNETNKMIEQENLDVRTITMGISLLDCIDSDLDKMNEKIYNKITTKARDLVATGDKIATEFGIPVVNKRVSVTPIALVGGVACHTEEDFVSVAKTLDKAAKTIGVNFIGGYSALVSKGMTPAEELLIRSIPQALAVTERVCSSVNVGSTKTGINMDAVKLMGEIVLETAKASADQDSLGCAKLVVFCNAPDDNPFMAGAFHSGGNSCRIYHCCSRYPCVSDCLRNWKSSGKIKEIKQKNTKNLPLAAFFAYFGIKMRCCLVNDQVTATHYLGEKYQEELQ